MGWAAIFLVLFSLFGYAAIYASAIPFVIVALIFGIKMLKERSRDRLISLNKRLLIATCILLVFLAAGIIGSIGVIAESALAPWPMVATVLVALSYLAALTAQIVAIVTLKKLPEEGVSDVLKS